MCTYFLGTCSVALLARHMNIQRIVYLSSWIFTLHYEIVVSTRLESDAVKAQVKRQELNLCYSYVFGPDVAVYYLYLLLIIECYKKLVKSLL